MPTVFRLIWRLYRFWCKLLLERLFIVKLSCWLWCSEHFGDYVIFDTNYCWRDNSMLRYIVKIHCCFCVCLVHSTCTGYPNSLETIVLLFHCYFSRDCQNNCTMATKSFAFATRHFNDIKIKYLHSTTIILRYCSKCNWLKNVIKKEIEHLLPFDEFGPKIQIIFNFDFEVTYQIASLQYALFRRYRVANHPHTLATRQRV